MPIGYRIFSDYSFRRVLGLNIYLNIFFRCLNLKHTSHHHHYTIIIIVRCTYCVLLCYNKWLTEITGVNSQKKIPNRKQKINVFDWTYTSYAVCLKICLQLNWAHIFFPLWDKIRLWNKKTKETAIKPFFFVAVNLLD